MNFFSRLSGIFKRQPKTRPALGGPMAASNSAVTISTPKQLEEFLRSGSTTDSGITVTPNKALHVGVVYACVRIISGTVANLPLDLKRRVDERTREDADDHWLWAILRRKPNRWQTPSEFKRMLQAHVLLQGNAYALIVRSLGRIVELIPLSADRMTVTQNDDLSLSYRYQRINGAEIEFKQEEIFHLRGMTLDGVRGVSPITYAREAIGLSMVTERHGAMLFKGGTTLGLVLEHPDKLGQEAIDNLKASLEDYRSTENAYKNLVLEEGMKLGQPPRMSSEDAQFLETRTFQRADVGMFYGVPPHMYGDTEKSTSWGTGIEQQSIGYVTYTAEDWLTMWEEAVNRDLVPANEPKLFARFNRAALLRGDMKSRWETHVKKLQWGVNSPNEVRATEDENPREGGDIYYPPPNTAGGEKAAGETEQNESAKAILRAVETIAAASREAAAKPSPVINVDARTDVHPAPVNVDVKTPEISVAPPSVNVAPASVEVHAHLPKRGDIVKTVTETNEKGMPIAMIEKEVD